MSRFVLPLLLLGGCAQKSVGDDLEKRVAALEEQVKSGGGAKSAAASPDEDAAKKLMEEAQEAIAKNDYATGKARLEEIVTKYPNTRIASGAKKTLPEVSLIGTEAKPIEVEKWYQGQAQLGESKATLLVFWETWCPHCKREVPKLPEMQAKWKDKGLEIVALTKVTKSSTDESVTEFLKENKIDLPVGKEKEGSMSAAYAVSGIPAAAIVKDGKVIWRGHPARLTDDVMEKLLSS